MPKYLIERDIPNAGSFTKEELQRISETSCGVLLELGPTIQWVRSYVTKDRITCVYIARHPDIIKEHARRGGFPADRIHRIEEVIDPTTAEGERVIRELVMGS